MPRRGLQAHAERGPSRLAPRGRWRRGSLSEQIGTSRCDVHVCMCVHVCACVRACACLDVRMYMCRFVCLSAIRLCVCMRVCDCVFTYDWMCARVCVCDCMYTCKLCACVTSLRHLGHVPTSRKPPPPWSPDGGAPPAPSPPFSSPGGAHRPSARRSCFTRWQGALRSRLVKNDLWSALCSMGQAPGSRSAL